MCYTIEMIPRLFHSLISAIDDRRMEIEYQNQDDAVVAIHRRNWFGSFAVQAKAQSFQIHRRLLEKEAPQDVNLKLAWFGISRAGVERIISHGFGLSELNQTNGLYGRGVYLSLDNSSCKSVQSADVDEDGLRYVLLCRVLLGRMEVVHPCSGKWFTSSVAKLDTHSAEKLQDVMANLQKFTSSKIICSKIYSRKVLEEFDHSQLKRVSDMKLLMYKTMYGKVKMQLMNRKKKRLMNQIELLQPVVLESKLLKSKCCCKLHGSGQQDIEAGGCNSQSCFIDQDRSKHLAEPRQGFISSDLRFKRHHYVLHSFVLRSSSPCDLNSTEVISHLFYISLSVKGEKKAPLKEAPSKEPECNVELNPYTL